MDGIYLFGLASRHNAWLSVRQSVVAGNIANANTPGYRALEVQPFETTLAATNLQMMTTRRGHLAPPGGAGVAQASIEDVARQGVHSGNTVELEQELMKSGEVSRAYSLNTSVVKAFRRMLMASVKG